MTPSAWIALGFGLASVVVSLIAAAISYGILKGTVSGMEKRLDVVEQEIGSLAQLKVDVAEVKTALSFLVEQFKDLNASIRWMREPAPAKPRTPRT